MWVPKTKQEKRREKLKSALVVASSVVGILAAMYLYDKTTAEIDKYQAPLEKLIVNQPHGILFLLAISLFALFLDERGETKGTYLCIHCDELRKVKKQKVCSCGEEYVKLADYKWEPTTDDNPI